jgi:replication factor C subunit 1
MNETLWIEKYKPTKLSEILCNRGPTGKINTWVSNWTKIRERIFTGRKNVQKTKKRKGSRGSKAEKLIGSSCLLITGSHGVGKTIGVEVVMEKYGYDTKSVMFRNMKLDNKNPTEGIKKQLNSSNVFGIMCNKKKQRVAIVIDEIESVTSTNDKKTILALMKLNDQEWLCPVIFISNGKHNKLLSEIQKNSEHVKFFPPFDSDLRTVLRIIESKEKIKISSAAVADMIIKHSQSDIRRLIYTLQDITSSCKNKAITEELMSSYCQSSTKKDVDINLYEATSELLYNYTTIDNCLRFYESEKVLLPLMVHQNYIESVIINVDSIKDKFDVIKSVGESLSTGDVVENYIYGDQSWEMQEIHGFHTCAATSYYLCEKVENFLKVGLDFTKDLNKTSIKKINKKNINNTNGCFDNMNIFDYIYINKIMRKLIEENKIEKCVQIMKDYTCQLEHIESLLKIDKIRNTKTILTSKQKKDFALHFSKLNEDKSDT